MNMIIIASIVLGICLIRILLFMNIRTNELINKYRKKKYNFILSELRKGKKIRFYI